jgi:hypothetical protein
MSAFAATPAVCRFTLHLLKDEAYISFAWFEEQRSKRKTAVN